MHRKMRLLSTNVLDMMKSKAFDGFLSGACLRKADKGALVFTPESGENAVFIVVSGRLRVFLSYEGREFTLAILEQGDIFSTHTRAMIEAMSHAEIMLMNTKDFREKLVAHPEISMAIVGILGDVLNSSLDAIESLVFQDVRQRLAQILIDEAEARGEQVADGVSVSMDLTTESLGLLIGASRQTTSQLINELIRLDLLEKRGNRSFVIKDLDALKDISRS
ncbi:Crp/Fnr family transcriptional regulator [Azospirillum picis]|nr:Crp/Fnr family transcriptional regulator [Azospirillum picis]